MAKHDEVGVLMHVFDLIRHLSLTALKHLKYRVDTEIDLATQREQASKATEVSHEG